MLTRGLVLISVLTLGACGGTDPTGIYQVTAHTISEDCATTQSVSEPPYIRIVEQSFFGAEFYTTEYCETDDVATCTAEGGLFGEEGDDFGGYISSASGGSTSCSLNYISYKVTLDGDVLTYTTEVHGETVMGIACTAEEATSRGNDMPCESREVITASRVK